MKKLYILPVIFLFSLTGFSQTGNKDSLLTAIKSVKKDSGLVNKQDTIPYVTLIFYRSYIPKIAAPIKKVPVYVNDTLMVNLKANTVVMVKVYKEGKINVAIDKKGDSEMTVKTKFGNEYFFSCTIDPGLWGGKPAFEQVTAEEGRAACGIFKSE